MRHSSVAKSIENSVSRLNQWSDADVINDNVSQAEIMLMFNDQCLKKKVEDPAKH